MKRNLAREVNVLGFFIGVIVGMVATLAIGSVLGSPRLDD